MLHQSLANQLPAEYLVRLQIESTHFYEDPTKPTSVQVHKACAMAVCCSTCCERRREA